MLRVIVHVLNDDPFVAEIDGLPDPRDSYLVLRHPRRRDGKRLPTIADGVKTILYPWHRITFIELLDTERSPLGKGFSRFSVTTRLAPAERRNS